MIIKKVGVVGCGLMGGGIAQVCAESGYETIAREINEELLEKGIKAIKANWDKAVSKNRMTEDNRGLAIQKLKGTIDMKDFGDCDIVIEAAIEQMDLKKAIFAELDSITPANAILATNTSCLSIIEIASATKRPEKVLGIHFFNPVPAMKLVEVIETISTSKESMETGIDFSQSLGKQVVKAKDSPGFIVNLLLIPFLLDSIRAYEKGLATKEDIDAGVKLGLNHPMGPLTLTDLVGLDTTYHIACAMYEETADPKYAPPVLLKQMVTAGWMGRKSGKGFYEYK